MVIVTIVFIATSIILDNNASSKVHQYDPEAITGVKFPETLTYDEVEAEADTFFCSCEGVHLHFRDSLNESAIKEMEQLCLTQPQYWRKDTTHWMFVYHDATYNKDGAEAVTCNIGSKTCLIKYHEDTSESTDVVMIFICISLALLLILPPWGFVLLIIHFVRKNKAKKHS